MNGAWRCGMMILTGVPAIVGGGLFWSLFQSWVAVILWEIVLLALMGIVIVKGGREPEAHH